MDKTKCNCGKEQFALSEHLLACAARSEAARTASREYAEYQANLYKEGRDQRAARKMRARP